jgi:transposase InsO family protein
MLDQTFERLTDDDTLLIHSDQGWHYQMKQYCNALRERGITQSMSRKGDCYDKICYGKFLWYHEIGTSLSKKKFKVWNNLNKN